jgi:hypothetical protein
MGTRAARPYRLRRVVARGPSGREKHPEGMEEPSQGLSPAKPLDHGPQSIRTLKAVQERHIARQEDRSGTPFRVHDEGERTAWGIVALLLNPRLESGTPTAFSWCANSPGAWWITAVRHGHGR